jgi:hypothetical protein
MLNFTAIYYRVFPYRRDVIVAIALAAIAGIASYQVAQLTYPVNYIEDVWFHGDCSLVFRLMVSPEADSYRRLRHPLFPAIAPALVHLLEIILGINPNTAIKVILAAIASLWSGMLFLLLRLLNCRLFDTTLLSVLAAVSAAAMFWFVVPESYPFGSLTILLGLCLAVVAERHRLSAGWYVAANVLTMSITITNWMVGIFVTILNNSRQRSLQIMALALCLVAIALGGYRVLRPFLFSNISSATTSVASTVATTAAIPPEADKLSVLKRIIGFEFMFVSDPISTSRSFVFHTAIAPAFQVAQQYNTLFTQSSPPGSGGTNWGEIAVLLWTALLGIGLAALFAIRKHRQLRIVLGLTLLGQLILHLIFGEETFLFSLHFLPLFVILLALSTLTKARPITLVLASMFVLSAGFNNALQLNKAINFLHSL